jgi:hypothetical protein
MTRRGGHRRIGRFTGLLVVAAVALGPVAACHDDGPKAGEARLRVDGQADLVRQGGGHEVVTDRADVRVGDEVRLTKGTGTLTLKGGAKLELRGGLDGAAASQVVMGPKPVVKAGDVLVTAPEGQTVSAVGTDLQVTDGSARVSSGVGLDVAAYDGDVALDSGGQHRTVPALREMQVPALGLPPESPHPLAYRPSDPWDRRFLSDAIELGQRLEAIAAGYTSNLSRGEGRTVAFYEQVLPGLEDEPTFTADLLDPGRPAGDTLVGAAISELGRRGTFVERWHSVFAFHDEGAAWGLVALDQGVDRAPLLGTVNEAVQGSPLAIGPPPTRPEVPPAGAVTTVTPPSSGSGPPPTTSTTRPPTTTTTQPPPDDGGNGLLNPVLDPVTNLLSGVLKALLGGVLPL